MLKRILGISISAYLTVFFVFILTGCNEQSSYSPAIVGKAKFSNTKPIVAAKSTFKPSVMTKTPSRNYSPVSARPEWYPPSHIEKNWKAIVVHHSATDSGNMAVFDEWHKNGHHWKGVGYDFVIGNGTGSGNGQTETTFRWKKQITGAHCGGTPDNWANKDAVGICLVGNFMQTRPTPQQMRSLVNLTRFLQQRYNIPNTRVYGHRDTPGYPGKTFCPGKFFPMYRYKSML